MLSITKTHFRDSFCGSLIDINDEESGQTCYFCYSNSGRFILIFKDKSNCSNSRSLIIFDRMSKQFTNRYFSSAIKSIKSVIFVKNSEENSRTDDENSVFNLGDVIIIINSDGGLDILDISNNNTILSSCFLLVNKEIISAHGFFNNGLIIVSLLTTEGIYLLSNSKYEFFENISELEGCKQITKEDVRKKKLSYYRLVGGNFAGNLSSCCISKLGRLYFSCQDEIFVLCLPNNEENEYFDFKIRQIYKIYGCHETNLGNETMSIQITDLVCYETKINDELFELIYIIFENENTCHHKNLALLQISANTNYERPQYFFISEFSKSCTHILTYKVFADGQIGVIWESDEQIYINIFNHLLYNNQKKPLNYSEYLTEKKEQKSDSFRDFTSLLYGDSPLIYFVDTDFKSSSQKTDEILKIHGRVFSSYLNVRDVEKEEFYIKKMIQSISLSDKHKTSNSIRGSCNRLGRNIDNGVKVNPLNGMKQFIFVGNPIFYCPINGIKNNDNITSLPNDWYSNMTFSIAALAGETFGDLCFFDVNYICWYQGLYEYLVHGLCSILKTPQMHLPILRRLKFVDSRSNYSKPTSIWTSLNSIKNIEDYKKISNCDLELLHSIIDLYVKNGIYFELIRFINSSVSNFIYILYSWSNCLFNKIYYYLNELTEKIELVLDPKEFSLRKQENMLYLITKLSMLSNDQKLLALFLSSNLTPLKSILSLLFFLFNDISKRQDQNELKGSIVDHLCLIKTLLDWIAFQEICFPILSKYEMENNTNITKSEKSSFQEQISSISLDCIRDLNVFNELPTWKKKDKYVSWKVMITIAFLLESYIKNKEKITESAKNGAEPNSKQEEVDPLMFELLREECYRQYKGLEMIASENFVSNGVLEALSSTFSMFNNDKKDCLNSPFCSELEELTKKRAIEAFHLDPDIWDVNVRPHSGSPANFALLNSILKQSDRIMGLSLHHGGHLTHGHYTNVRKVNFSSYFFESLPYLTNSDGIIDYDKLEENALLYRPKVIIAGASGYPREINFKRFREICDRVRAYLMVDISHYSCLIVAGKYPSPKDYADFITSTSHKILRGPRSEKINYSVTGEIQSSTHFNQVSALCTQLKYVKSENWRRYANDIIINSKTLCNELKEAGIEVLTDGTDSHKVMINTISLNLNGSKAEKALEVCNISSSRSSLPCDGRTMSCSGVRLGTTVLTTRGLTSEDMKFISILIFQCLKVASSIQAEKETLDEFIEKIKENNEIKIIREKVTKFASKFELICSIL
ncbi:cytosolic serine hydroxymethyl transferase [Cryptosporidium bovis]|uniref:cytosolic serine hydroxymethyl transferase n=1 Tax=Cryptosporidium bovis TaxID=310047 RepID=UPI00351A992D|nr:cytosolic serine hydroxymethyl transferase [Cryptosporidium bovis]